MDLFGRKRIAELERANAKLNSRLGEWEAKDSVAREINFKLSGLSRAVGRIITKLDPMYGISEFDEKRRAESDKLADDIINKFIAEHRESNKLSNPDGN